MKRQTLFFFIITIIGVGMIIRSFFGWNGNKENTHQEGPGFVEEIANTGDNKENNIDNKISINKQKTGDATPQNDTEIKIIMPRYFYNTGRTEFKKDLFNNQKIYINFIFVDDLNSYRDFLSDPDFSEADLFLFPYDRKEIVNTTSFSLDKNVKSTFDKFVSPIIKNEKIGFLPFAADPIIMYSSIELSQNNFSAISDSIYKREPKTQLAFPIFFGITKEDYENKGFSREYQDIIRYALMHYFKTYQDAKSLGLRIDSNVIEGNNESKNYNVYNLNNIFNIITNSECKYFPSICFQAYNFVGIRFGFLSDKDIVQTYFSNKKSNFEKISLSQIPFYYIESPVRIRGRGILSSIKDTHKINNISKFIMEYINKHNEYNLRNSTLSVFKEENNSLELLDNEYIGLRGYILDSGGDYINTLRNINKFRDLIEYKITPKEYLK